MTDLVAAVLAYVRTEDGVVELHAGDLVPDDAQPEHVQRLVDAGVLVSTDGDAAAVPSAATIKEVLAQVGDDPAAAAAALELERAGENRKTLVEALEKIASSGEQSS